MNFTREPIIETIITPREGFKLVIRNSKESGHEEYFVDSLEVVTFGHSCFYRSLERPKCFLLPVADYEILEVRETRMVLKNASIEKGIKIGGGREASVKTKEIPYEKEVEPSQSSFLIDEGKEEISAEPRLEKRKERRRFRKRRLKEDPSLSMDELNEEEAEQHDSTFQERESSLEQASEWAADLAESDDSEREKIPIPVEQLPEKPEKPERKTGIPSLLPPPATLISETLSRYKDTPIFSGAFYEKAETSTGSEQSMMEESSISLKDDEEDQEEIEREPEEFEDESSPSKDSDLPF